MTVESSGPGNSLAVCTLYWPKLLNVIFKLFFLLLISMLDAELATNTKLWGPHKCYPTHCESVGWRRQELRELMHNIHNDIYCRYKHFQNVASLHIWLNTWNKILLNKQGFFIKKQYFINECGRTWFIVYMIWKFECMYTCFLNIF